MSSRIAVLIPSTSNGRKWSSIKESYLYMYTLKTLLLTYDAKHEWKIYIGIDRGDPVYDNTVSKKYLESLFSVMKNVDSEIIYMDGISKGHLTVMWNRLFEKAYNDGYDYFYQCGDDIVFETKGWANDCIQALEKTNGVGMTGPINNNNRILTQSFVSRKHMELFGKYFPEEIINWCCDDWINEVYVRLNCFYPLVNHKCNNEGGHPRYIVNNNPAFFGNKYQSSVNKLREDTSIIAKRDAEQAVIKLTTSITR